MMKPVIPSSLLLALLLSPVILRAQGNYEVGVIGLVTSYKKVNVESPDNSGKVGPKFGPAAGFVIGQSIGDHWGGEFRYVYFKNDIELSSSSTSTEFSAESHAVHYDVLYYFSDLDARVRPYVAIGGGVKVFRGTGQEQAFQPLSDLALLTKTTQAVPVGDVGFGVKVRVGSGGMFRIEFRDYISPVPDEIIVESLDSKIGNLLHHFAPLVGFTWTF